MGSSLGQLVAVWLAFMIASAAALAQSNGTVRLNPQEDQRPPPETVTVARALDKVTAQITDLELPENRTVVFGSLAITARHCESTPPTEAPETFAFLQIDEIEPDQQPQRRRLFSGWMIASSPALNPLQHPVYDVWVIGCEATRAG